jgi:hypothetical protein
MLDILYVSHNRLELTRESFTALLENTNWDEHVDRNEGCALYVMDDGSVDGTAEWLGETIEKRNDGRIANPVIVYDDRPFGGPVSAINRYLDLRTPIDRFAKIDNDFVVCPGWLDEMSRQMTARPELDILGMEPWNPGPPHSVPFWSRVVVDAQHIGGKGIVRKRAFERCRPNPNGDHGYGGFTEWQLDHPGVTKAWIAPDMPCFGLDQLPFEPWLTLTEEYRVKGWHRAWPSYASDGTMNGYWDWWKPRYM